MAQSLFLRWLHEKRPAVFHSDFGVDESVRRLSAIVKKWPSLLPFRRTLTGRVTAEGVTITRQTGGYEPVFYGAFHVRDGVTMLEGYFALSRYTRVSMSCWFGFVILGIVFSAYAVLSGRPIYTNRPMAQWQAQLLIISIPCLLLVSGLLIMLFYKWRARNEAAIISQQIEEALRADGEPITNP